MVGASMMALSRLVVEGCRSLATLPDLSKSFPGLSELTVKRCDVMTALSSSRPLIALTLLEVNSCSTLTGLPELEMFPALEWLKLEECRRLVAFEQQCAFDWIEGNYGGIMQFSGILAKVGDVSSIGKA